MVRGDSGVPCPLRPSFQQVGQLRPDGVQRLLNHAEWDEDAVRDDLRDYVVETIGDKNAVLIGHDTGLLKKGTKSAFRKDSGPSGTAPGEGKTV